MSELVTSIHIKQVDTSPSASQAEDNQHVQNPPNIVETKDEKKTGNTTIGIRFIEWW